MSKSIWKQRIENVLFNTKWLLVLFYFALVAVLVMYGVAFTRELWMIMSHAWTTTMDEIKIIVLDTVDIVMIANLVKMIITGSYNSFVSKDHGHANENISSGTLKVKISTSIQIVASIHLLKAFVNEGATMELVEKQLMIFGALMLSALVLQAIDYIHVKTEVLEHENHTDSSSH